MRKHDNLPASDLKPMERVAALELEVVELQGIVFQLIYELNAPARRIRKK
jgi:hypothetical protein